MIDYSALSRALQQLETSIGYLNSEPSRKDDGLRRQFRAATIQAFEFTYELAVKMIRRQLAEIVANPGELREIAFMDLIRTAAEAGLVRDPAPFRAYRELRNISSHAYDENKAEQVIAGTGGFVGDIRFLLSELSRRNHAAN